MTISKAILSKSDFEIGTLYFSGERAFKIKCVDGQDVLLVMTRSMCEEISKQLKNIL